MLDADLFNDQTPLSEYRSEVWRVVESQEEAATMRLVSDLAEQQLLEQMLDDAKPRYRDGTQGMHYLLKTAFRYPPLQYGSRFGTRAMPSYFYASETQATALCESAYYRFLFLDDMHEPYVGVIQSEFTLFNVKIGTNACLDLCDSRYHGIKQKLEHVGSYGYTQKIGEWTMGQARIDAIRFTSARSKKGRNIAVAEPSTIRSKQPISQQNWLCLTKAGEKKTDQPHSVSFRSRQSEVSYVFNYSMFCDESGRFLRVEG